MVLSTLSTEFLILRIWRSKIPKWKCWETPRNFPSFTKCLKISASHSSVTNVSYSQNQSCYFNNSGMNFLWLTFSVLLQIARKLFSRQPTPLLKLFQLVLLTLFSPAKTKSANLSTLTPLLALTTAEDSFLDRSLSFLAATLISLCLQVSLICMP